MTSLQRYVSEGRSQGVSEQTLDAAEEVIQRIKAVDPRIEPVLTLRHLAYLTDTRYFYLRQTVNRTNINPYKCFSLKKKMPGRRGSRLICVPDFKLMNIQKWIVQNILKYVSPHRRSYAFHPDCRPLDAAFEHSNSEWLLKIDLKDFFHSVTERKVERIFRRIGFTNLLAFELARLTTVCAADVPGSNRSPSGKWKNIPTYEFALHGILPQGAPTSPMLANLAMIDCDKQLDSLANQLGVRFTRYADDIAFSSKERISVSEVRSLRRNAIRILNESGFRHNQRKTVFRGAGSRKIVLGMLVDGARPRLPRKFKEDIKLQLHFLVSKRHGPSVHAGNRGTSVSGVYHRLRGQIAWSETVEPEFGKWALEQFHAVSWPVVGAQ